MKKKVHSMESLINLTTKSCGIIACYGAVIALVIFYPIKSTQVHNSYAHLVALIFYPAAAILTVICAVQIITTYFKEFFNENNFEGNTSKLFFTITGIVIMLFLVLLIMVIPLLSIYQEFR